MTGTAAAPVEDVWKLLFDPSRFPEWWSGVQTVRVGTQGAYTIWQDGYPDLPVPQLLRSDRRDGRITMSCQVSAIEFSWQLDEDGAGTRITVRVDIPAAEAHWLGPKREVIATSLAALARLAEADAPAGRPAMP